MKKFFTVILSFALIFAMIAIPSPAWAEGEVVDSGDIDENVSWTLESLEGGGYKLIISGKGELVKPYPLPWGDYAEMIREVVIEDGITSVGKSAFYSIYTSLETVHLADSVTSIGALAFCRCNNLKTINLPEGLTSIGDRAFSQCNSLTEITIPDSVTVLYPMAFINSTGLKSVSLGAGITRILNQVFEGCSSLENVSMSDNVTEITSSAFKECTSLKTIRLSENLVSLGNMVFSGCSALTEITIPDGVTEIGAGAFDYCTDLKRVSLGNGLAKIERSVFAECSSLTDITIPETVTSVQKKAFEGCYNLLNIVYYGKHLNWEGIQWEESFPDVEGATRYDVIMTDAEATGSPVHPVVLINQGQTVLNEGTDYEVTFGEETIEAGSTGKVSVTFIGDYQNLPPVCRRYTVLAGHDWGPWYHVDGTYYHAHNCYLCDETEAEVCDFEEWNSFYGDDGSYYAYYRCTVCGFEIITVNGMPLTRIYGPSRYETSMNVADAYMEKAGINKLDGVVIATGTEFPDALSGSYLSISKDAPILLVNLQTLFQNNVINYIKWKVKAGGTVYLLGGYGVIPESFENTVGSLGYNVIRCAGSNRYETNINILEQIGVGDDLLVCSGLNYPDAATASATGLPILLVNGKTLTEEQISYLESIGKKNIYIIGGIGVISPELGEVLAQYDNDDFAWRVAGTDRAVTAKFVAQQFFPAKVTQVVFASGNNFPDCISGGLLAHELGAPILYAGDNKTYIDQARDYFVHSGAIYAYALGGPAVVSDSFIRTVIGW